MRWKRRPVQSMSCHCLSEAASHDVQNLRQHRQIPSRTRLRISGRPSASRRRCRRCRRDYTLYLPPGHVNLRLSSRGAFLSRSRRSLKARIGHSCVRPYAPESGCTQYAIGREHEDASNVRDGHLCNGGKRLYIRCISMNMRSRIDWESRIPFTFLMSRQLKKNHPTGNVVSEWGRIWQSDETDRNNVYSTGRDWLLPLNTERFYE